MTQCFLFKQEMRLQITLTFNKEYEDRKGKILTFNFNKPDEPPIELPLKNFNRTGFNPHGISVYWDPSTGVVSLFVINHRAGEQVVEIFDFDRQTHSLIHRRSVIDELIWSPNNLYAIGKGVIHGVFTIFEQTMGSVGILHSKDNHNTLYKLRIWFVEWWKISVLHVRYAHKNREDEYEFCPREVWCPVRPRLAFLLSCSLILSLKIGNNQVRVLYAGFLRVFKEKNAVYGWHTWRRRRLDDFWS